jgi:hypothetical protein
VWPRDIARGQVVEGLTANDHAGVAVLAEDDRRAGNAVVVARHRKPVGAGGGGDDHIARLGVLEQGLAHDHVAGLAVLASEDAGRGRRPAEAIGDVGFVARAVEHRTQVVGHAAVDGHPGGDVALDRLDRVEREAGVRRQRPTRLDEETRVRGDAGLVDGAHKRAHPLLDLGRVLALGVGHAKPATEVIDGEPAHPVADLSQGGDLAPERLQVQELGADVSVHTFENQAVDASHTLDRGGNVGHREAELRSGLAGGDLLVGVAAHVGGSAYQHGLPIPFSHPGRQRRMRRCPRPCMHGLASRRMRRLENIDESGKTVDLVEVVDHDQGDLRAQSHLQLGHGLGVAVHHDPLGSEAGVQGQMKLAAGGHVAPEPLLGEQAEHGGAGKGLGGEHHVEVLVAGGATSLDERVCARTQVLLGDDVRRRAELAGQLDRVAPPHLDVAALVEAAAEREHVRERRIGGHIEIMAKYPGRNSAQGASQKRA